jgi:SagB-type dehydrogenase family enzyme
MESSNYHVVSSLPADPFRNDGLRDPATWPSSWTRLEVKYTAALEKIPLSRLPISGDLSAILAGRKSRRAGGQNPWTVEQVGTLLGHSVGPRQDENTETFGDRRAYPSAGARFPVEIYLVSDHLTPRANVFHYSVLDHRLDGVRKLEDLKASVRGTFGTDWTASAFGILFLSAVLERSSRKYDERAYRYSLLESGHLAQNLCVVAEAMGSGIAPVGGFADRMANAIVGADGEQEIVTYAIALT